MGKIKKPSFNLNIATIVVESALLPLALFLLFSQLWGLIMRKGPFLENFWGTILMDMKTVPGLYVVAFSILGVFTWFRIWLYQKKQKKDKAEEAKNEEITRKLIENQDATLKLANEIMNKLNKKEND
jgi:hypothetical protein